MSLLENLVFKGIRGIKSDLTWKKKEINLPNIWQTCVTCRSKSFCSFLSTLYTTTYNIRFSTYSSNILYNNFNLVLKQTHSGTKTYQKLCYILVHTILTSIMCHTIVPWKRHNKIWSSKKFIFLITTPCPSLKIV